jgi:hypothetical protein
MLGAWYWPSRVFDEAPLVLLACAASPLLVWIPEGPEGPGAKTKRC